MAVVELEDVKARLNKGLNVDDYELLSMIDAAVAEYEEVVGRPTTPQVDTQVVRPTLMSDGLYGIYTRHIPVVSVDSISDGYGTTVDATDYVLADATHGLIRPAADGVLSLSTSWPAQVVITYTYGGLPANHAEFIAAEVAGYFARTQRGGGAGPSFASEGYEAAYDSNPVQLFPRLALLAERVNRASIA